MEERKKKMVTIEMTWILQIDRTEFAIAKKQNCSLPKYP